MSMQSRLQRRRETLNPDDELIRIINSTKLSKEEKVGRIRHLQEEEDYEPPLRKLTRQTRLISERTMEEDKRCPFFCQDLCYSPFRCCLYGCGICVQILMCIVGIVAFIWFVGYVIGWNNGANPVIK